ncbi:hypothetical protein PspLS_05308 [Pyricularia sp. CBS 133598]|nr:hypothetical protein PspLS_05308 [Pyricularia sp. CBS 133598]
MAEDEAESVASWLLAQREPNLTTLEDAGEWSNTIVAVSAWRPLSHAFNKNTDAVKVRNLLADFEAQERWLFRHTREINDITWDLFNGTILGLNNDAMDAWGIDPILLPTGLFALSDFTGRDHKKWQLEGWLYNGVFYNSTEEFHAAHRRPGFEKIGVNVEGGWTSGDHQGPMMPLDDRAAPRLVAPTGCRFSLEKEQRYVEWMGFSFFLGFTRDAGTSLHDIRFEGERILYEIQLQEALSHYAGNDPVHSMSSFLDTFYGFGQYAVPLVPGFDYYPLQRHSTEEYTSVTRNVQFVVRQVATIFNYDYTFSLDGSSAVDTRASGYIQVGHRGKNQDYGFAIQDHLSGSMHDHVLKFKLDLDVLGTANTVELVRTVPVTTSYPWLGGASRNTMQLRRFVIADEEQGPLDWDADGATQLLVVNTGAKNKFGENRGYRVVPKGAGKLTVRDSSDLRNAVLWAGHDVHVTRQKNEEPWASHAYQNQNVHNPPADFLRLLNGESLMQEDLVLWVNLGMHHLPNSMDVPHTLTTSARTGIRLEPSNLFETNPYRRTVQMVRISRDEYGDTTDLNIFGQSLASYGLRVDPVDSSLGLFR